MQHAILVFNRDNLGEITEEYLLNSITESNFETLCRQYGLEPSLVEPTLRSLKVVGTHNDVSPFFLVKYDEGHTRTVVVQQWDASNGGGKQLLEEVIEGISLRPLRSQLLDVRWLVEVALAPVQLKNMGLLLAYEIARWAADRGNGIVYGLDGAWYRLNQYKAFIPINLSGK